MWCWQHIDFHVQGTNLIERAAIKPDPVVKDHVADNIPLEVFVIFFGQLDLLRGGFCSKHGNHFFFQLIISLAPVVFAASSL